VPLPSQINVMAHSQDNLRRSLQIRRAVAEADLKRQVVEYGDEWPQSPTTYWVEIEPDRQPWHQASQFDLPKPLTVPGWGYASFHVQVGKFTSHFTSLVKLRA
jgi:hypothetical protein